METPSPVLEVHEPVRMAIRDAFASPDGLDLGFEFRRRACVVKTISSFLEGALQVRFEDR